MLRHDTLFVYMCITMYHQEDLFIPQLQVNYIWYSAHYGWCGLPWNIYNHELALKGWFTYTAFRSIPSSSTVANIVSKFVFTGSIVLTGTTVAWFCIWNHFNCVLDVGNMETINCGIYECHTMVPLCKWCTFICQWHLNTILRNPY